MIGGGRIGGLLNSVCVVFVESVSRDSNNNTTLLCGYLFCLFLGVRRHLTRDVQSGGGGAGEPKPYHLFLLLF